MLFEAYITVSGKATLFRIIKSVQATGNTSIRYVFANKEDY